MKVYILFFPEDSRIRIVLRQAKSTCFVDSMYVGLGKERVLWAEAVDVPGGLVCGGYVALCQRLAYLYRHCTHVFTQILSLV